jgi:hypothetical protein
VRAVQADHAGANIAVRFSWSEITPRSARWEQAFSPDDGNPRETNWIMEFTRQLRCASGLVRSVGEEVVDHTVEQDGELAAILR